ncbi:MAG: hypothetical protein ACI8Z1_000897 [Candidatus Azotimanducaceae bacterium]|jgi:hypothetical protein
MKIYSSIEARMPDAVERGNFDNLPSQGKPRDLGEWGKPPAKHALSCRILRHTKQLVGELHLKIIP